MATGSAGRELNLWTRSDVLSYQGTGGGIRLSGAPITNDDDAPGAADSDGCSDAELIRRMKADDLDAFEAFFVRHRILIFRTAYGLTGDRHAAEEVLQDTFARAYRHRATLLLGRVAGAVASPRRPEPVLLAAGPAPDRRAEPIDEATATMACATGRSSRPRRAEQAELRHDRPPGDRALPAEASAASSSCTTSTACPSRRRRPSSTSGSGRSSRGSITHCAMPARPSRGRPPVRAGLRLGTAGGRG